MMYYWSAFHANSNKICHVVHTMPGWSLRICAWHLGTQPSRGKFHSWRRCISVPRVALSLLQNP